MKTEDNNKAQLMRDKARENAAFYYPTPGDPLLVALKICKPTEVKKGRK